MKKQLLLFVLCAATVLGIYAAAPATEPAVVALRFVSAAHAFTAIRQELGAKAAEAVSGVDEKRNTVALDSAHPQTVVVRAFLAGLDHQPPEVRVVATVTQRSETPNSPARNEVLSHQAVLSARPEVIDIPGGHGPTRIELRMTQLSK